jgi:hypothetical protein
VSLQAIFLRSRVNVNRPQTSPASGSFTNSGTGGPSGSTNTPANGAVLLDQHPRPHHACALEAVPQLQALIDQHVRVADFLDMGARRNPDLTVDPLDLAEETLAIASIDWEPEDDE